MMLSYLFAETSYLRAYGNRCLLLLFLCALSRSGHKSGSASALGLSLDLSTGQIIVFGLLLMVLLLVSLRAEANSLRSAREFVLKDFSTIPRRLRSASKMDYVMFAFPVLVAAFLTVQYVQDLVPSGPGCVGYVRWRQFYDFSFPGGSPSTFCIGDQTEGMPWIYPPYQAYLYVLCVAASAYLALDVMRGWATARGT